LVSEIIHSLLGLLLGYYWLFSYFCLFTEPCFKTTAERKKRWRVLTFLSLLS
jgi:hypothetical protein